MMLRFVNDLTLGIEQDDEIDQLTQDVIWRYISSINMKGAIASSRSKRDI